MNWRHLTTRGLLVIALQPFPLIAVGQDHIIRCQQHIPFLTSKAIQSESYARLQGAAVQMGRNWEPYSTRCSTSASGETRLNLEEGYIPPPPVPNRNFEPAYDFIAYWYQDFGLPATDFARGKLGNVKWYNWSWLYLNQQTNIDQLRRTPLLGYYRGDDSNVLGWQSLWLYEAGVSTVIVQQRGDFEHLMRDWANENDINHWLHVLFNETPNFKFLRYIPWVWSGGTKTDYEIGIQKISASFGTARQLFHRYKNYDCVDHDGKCVPIVFVFEFGNWLSSFRGDTSIKSFLAAQAKIFKEEGFGGLAILARNAPASVFQSNELREEGLLLLSASYVDSYNPTFNKGATPPKDYADLARGVDIRRNSDYPYDYSVPAVATARFSHPEHSSKWSYEGSTPQLFSLMLSNALCLADKLKSPKLITIYNVSEWAEGGPSLQPNAYDGDDYLIALKNHAAQKHLCTGVHP